jgi:phosphonate transport system substrate-binding protein
MKRIGFLAACGVVLSLVLASPAHAANVGLAVTDLEGMEQLQREFGKFRELLGKYSGHEFTFYPVTSRTAAAEALKSKKVDFVLTGPAEYVVLRKKTDAYPVVGFSRPDYCAAIVVMADSGIFQMKQLKGKKVALGDVGSTSNHLGPSQVMADYGLDPRRDVQVVHVARNVAWEALKRGDVAAVGMNYTTFLNQRAKEKDLEPGAFRVIGRGPDLPNDVLMAGKHVDPKVVESVRQVFGERSKELIQAVLVGEDNQKYRGMKFLTTIKDSDYDYVRSMYTAIGYPAYAEFVGK